MPYAATPPITQPSIGLAHAPKYTPPHSANEASNAEVPVDFSAGLGGPYQPELLFGLALLPGRLAWASGPAERTIRNQGDVAAGCAVAAEALVEAASAGSPMRLHAKMFGESPMIARRPWQIQFRVFSVVTRCALPPPLPRRCCELEHPPLELSRRTPGHFLLNRSFPVHHPRLTPAAPAALRCPWNGDEAAHARRLPAPEFELASTPRRPRHAR